MGTSVIYIIQSISFMLKHNDTGHLDVFVKLR